MLISNLLRKVTTHQLIKQFIIFILATLPFLGYSQQRFSLEEAVQRAQKSNGRLNIQKLDAVDAEHQLKEYYAIGIIF